MDKLKQKYNIISLNFADAKPPTELTQLYNFFSTKYGI